MHHSVSVLGLGYRRYEDPVPFGISQPDRLLHVYAIGQTGAGKSTLLSNLAWQDAQSGIGFCLIDPHGDLAESLHVNLGVTHRYWDIADTLAQADRRGRCRVDADRDDRGRQTRRDGEGQRPQAGHG